MKVFLAILSFCILAGCLETAIPEHSPEEDSASIKQVLLDQQNAWNEGDIEMFMEGYWKSDSLSFISSRGVNKGWQETLDGYKKGYPTKEDMGELKFDILQLNRLSDAAYQMVGKYTLTRQNDMPSGFFTLIWRKISGKWVIVADQTCG